MHNNTSGFNTVALVLAIIVIIAGGLFYYQTTSAPAPEDGVMMEQSAQDAIEEDEMMESGEEAMMGDEDAMMEDGPIPFSGTLIAGESAPLLDFNQSDYEKAVASDKLVALYFYANWCPICKEEVANALYPAFNELARSDVVGFRVNYNDNETDDNERDLAREFGVAYQHTKVFLKSGERVLKSPESWNKERYASEIEQAL
ncbi:MAG: thioredoxin family protein [Parcubacteria group bacterium]|nr:thioredoxin family protein [Parcubacteria group bacterium]